MQIIEFITLKVKVILLCELYLITQRFGILRDSQMKYNERIRNLRETHFYTQQRIADLLNVGQRTYCDYESGKTRIPVDSLITLAKFYDVSMDYISGVADKVTPFPKR